MKSIMKNRISEILGIKYPIMQRLMSWLRNVKSVAAVSNADKLRILGSNTSQMIIITFLEKTTERMRKKI